MPLPASFVGTDRFEVSTLLGEGATGSVYRVLDRETSRHVALKTLRLPAAEALYRLKREFRTRAGLVHPNLLQLHELFVEGDSCFFTMEAIDGVDFLHWARGGLGLGGGGSTLEGSTASTQDPALPTAAERPLPPPPHLGTRGTEHAWERLRRALAQLFEALRALHGTGLVHRDIKPSNVLVTPQERVVVLDFGLTSAPHTPGSAPPRPHRPVGTPTYMAPEQVTGGEVTPAADLYAVGAMLYEALTGSPPFAVWGGSPLEHKVHRLPPHVLELAPHAPEDLARLAMDLLTLDPRQRPGSHACKARLAPLPHESPQPVESAGPGSLFVGRAHELEVLSQALEEVVGQGRQVTVHLRGPSGIGKSTLVRHFLAHHAPALAPVVLHGRCHPQESLPYKALDASIDALARHLESLPPHEAAALVPSRAPALAQLFPVLGRLAAFQRVPSLVPLPDAAELRRQGTQALRELLERLARGPRPLVLWVDDVQWGDTDSLPLFEELLRPPAPPLLWVLTWRDEDRDTSPLLRHLLRLTRPGEGSTARELVLGALPEREVGALASALLGSGEDSPQVQAIIAQAEGNPFIARELAHHVGVHAARAPGSPGAHVDVARLVLERIQSLPEEERTLLEVASLSGRPLARGIVLRAAKLGEGDRMRVASLRDSGLLREVPGEGEPGLGAYHDRIREALLDALPAEARARRHRAVAVALAERGSEDDEALLLHWEGAGEPLQAGHHAVRSAERASRALAFEHAATLYRKALELLGPRADRPTLLERLAESLANLGRAPDAAHHYLEAVRALGGALEQPRVRDLQRRASEQYLKSGRIDEGWRELHAVLRAHGVSVPGSLLSAVWAATWRRLLFLTRHRDLDAPAATAVSPEERRQLEVLWTTCTSWTMVNPILSDAFRTMHLLGARRLGDATTLSRALALEATMELHTGGRLMEASARRLLEQVRRQVERTGGPYDRAWYALALVNQGYTQGRWREVVEAAERAETLFREHCPGSDWERGTLAIFHHHALAMRGDLRQLASRLESFHREALQRGDLHARGEAWLGEPVVAWLARDMPDEARAQADEALATQLSPRSTWPVNAYRRQQFARLIASVYIAHYQGQPWPAWRAVLEQWAPLKASFMLSLRTTGLNLRHMRARAALAAAASLAHERSLPPEGVEPRWRRAALLADVRAQVRDLEKDPLGCARPIGDVLRAGLAWLEGDVAEARKRLEASVEGFEREHMALYREASRYALGALRGGPEGQAVRRRAEEWMEAQGVLRPGALAAALVPGIAVWPEARPAQ
ncbi:protein kinase domain-containing protein [Archangium sp.]|uniref:serine/threonine-protein kinase n=1 Tax=Archangium sp. TaxID=1872627 RepID=UPI00286C9888|nr:AAA family ATPase [Archangium sp.]